jgi:addiction module RelE/StbE family toxin
MAAVLKVLWTENSIQDLLAIKEFISLDSTDRAEKWISELYSSGENLATFSQRGRVVPEFNQEDIRELLIENYRLVYRIKTTSVEILTVFEGHRRLTKKDIKK